MSTKFLTTLKITQLLKRLKKSAQSKLLRQNYLKIIQNHLYSLSYPQLSHSLCSQILKLQNQSCECLLIDGWWAKRNKVLQMINDEIQTYQNRRELDKYKRQRQQQLGRLILLIRYYHIQIGQLLLRIDQIYNIASNFNQQISFFIYQIQHLQTRFILNHILCILYPHIQPITQSFLNIDPFFTQLPAIDNVLLKILRKVDYQQHKISTLKSKIKALKTKLQRVVNKHQKYGRYKTINNRPLSKSLNFIESNPSKLLIPFNKWASKYSHKLAPVRSNNNNLQRNQYVDNDNQRKYDKLKRKRQESHFLNQGYYKQSVTQYQQGQYKEDDQRNDCKQKNNSQSIFQPSYRTLGDYVKQKNQNSSLSSVVISQNDRQLQSQRYYYQKQRPNENQFKILKYKIHHNKKHKFYRSVKKPICQNKQDNKNITERKVQLIKYTQHIAYNPILKQSFDIRSNHKIKYTYDAVYKINQQNQASQTIESLQLNKQLSLINQQVQTLPHIQLQMKQLNNQQQNCIKNKMIEEDLKKQTQIQNQRIRINKLLQFVEKNKKYKYSQHRDEEITIDQDYLVEEDQAATLRVINQKQRDHLNRKLGNNLTFNKRQTVRQKMIKNEEGSDMRMTIYNKGQKDVLKLINNLQIKQQYRKLFNMDKLMNWISKRQTYHIEFSLNGRLAVEVLFSPVYNKTLLLKLWAPIRQVIKQQQCSFLFSYFIQFLSELCYFSKLMYIGASFSQLQTNKFQNIKDKIYVKDIKTSNIQSIDQIERYFNFQIVCMKQESSETLYSVIDKNDEIFIDKNVLLGIGLGKNMQLNGVLGEVLEKNGLKEMKKNIKARNCTYFKETIQFRTSFIVNYPFYHFAQVDIIRLTPHPIFRIPTTINRGFIYLAPSVSLSVAIQAVGNYDRNKQLKKVRLSMRMFKKNIQAHKINKDQLIVGQLVVCWQLQLGLLQVQFQREMMMDVQGVCLLQLQGKIGFGMIIRQQDYLF